MKTVTPDYAMPEGGLNIRPNDHPLTQEARLHDHKIAAAQAYVAANGLDRIVFAGGASPKVGIVTVGKSYLDVRQALEDLGIDEVKAADLGVRLYKVACPWPLEPQGLKRFAEGLDLILVVEEKRPLIEAQVKEILYGTANAPAVVGKRDEEGRPLLTPKGALDANDIAIAIGERVVRVSPDEKVSARLDNVRGFQQVLARTEDVGVRTPYFCAGCPHNSSTVVPEGARAYAGIGCHYMVQWMDRSTEGYTQMGGEGANWVGEAPFSKRGHVFQNIGDGTYNHSGYLAIRAAKAAGVNITYKILYNDAVAMTGGQHHEGNLTVDEIARQVAAEGAKKIFVVTDEPDKYAAGTRWPEGLQIRHRDELIATQEELAKIEGLTVLIYDQTCAAEKRRRRKRGQFPDPQKRVVINEAVCEGCGDCGVQSNCVAVTAVETEFGRKRQIDQSSCNKDYSCLKGFCPSFVTVEGADLLKAKPAVSEVDPGDLPVPDARPLYGTYGIVVTGVGGTGVVTIGALIGMAAHLEGKGCGVIDMAGLAQKGGAVMTHIKLADDPSKISAIRVAAGGADLVLGCDMVTAGSKKVLASMARGRTTVVLNTHETYPGDLTRRPDFSLPVERLKRAIAAQAGEDHVSMIEATALATKLMGDAILGNIFMLGYAFQLGALPLKLQSLEEAIRLNGVAVEENLTAFRLGRKAAIHPQAVEAMAREAAGPAEPRALSRTLDEVIARRVEELTAYQNRRYAGRYRKQVERVRAAEEKAVPGETALTEAVARNLHKLMAYKDEYEVARLYANGDFEKKIKAMFGDGARLTFHLAPPTTSKIDPRTGRPRKKEYGPGTMRLFRLLSAMRGLRGTPFDVFGYAEERRTERRLVRDYLGRLDEILDRLTPQTHATAVALASLPEKIRGYGPVKAASLEVARAEEATLLEALRGEVPEIRQAAE